MTGSRLPESEAEWAAYGQIGDDDTCTTCGMGDSVTHPEHEPCPKSKRSCGHHCEHSWSHDSCCWCKASWGEGGSFTPGEATNDGRIEVASGPEAA